MINYGERKKGMDVPTVVWRGLQRPEAVIVSAARTPIGRFRGALGAVRAAGLGAVVRAAVARAGIANPAVIDEVLLGNVVGAGLGQNIARQIAIHAGLPSSVGALTINKVCGASLKTVMLAAQAIRAGDGAVLSRAAWKA